MYGLRNSGSRTNELKKYLLYTSVQLKRTASISDTTPVPGRMTVSCNNTGSKLYFAGQLHTSASTERRGVGILEVSCVIDSSKSAL